MLWILKPCDGPCQNFREKATDFYNADFSKTLHHSSFFWLHPKMSEKFSEILEGYENVRK